MSRKLCQIEGVSFSENLTQEEEARIMAKAAQTLGRIRTPKKARASVANGRKSHARKEDLE